MKIQAIIAATSAVLAYLGGRRQGVINIRNDCDEPEAAYDRLVIRARASERITPEGLEQVYAMSISVSDIEIDRLVAAGELEPGTLRPLRSDFALAPSPKQAVTDQTWWLLSGAGSKTGPRYVVRHHHNQSAHRFC